MFYFMKITLVMVSLHSNKDPKIEVSTRDWDISVIGQNMFCSEEFGLWYFGLGRQWNALSTA